MTTHDERGMRARIDRHFAGAIAPDDERALREHLPGCAGCRTHYQRHLVLASLDPAAPDAAARIGRGLGLRPRRPALLPTLGLVAAGAAAAVLLVARPFERDALDAPSAFSVRGPVTPPPALAAGPELRVFRLRAGAPPAPVEGAIAAGDELAFAYRNPGGHARLMVLGIDEHRHVYWYHPEWSEPAARPTAVPIAAGPGVHELPAAIAHRLDGRTLRIVGLFAGREVSVAEVEDAVRRLPDADGSPLLPQTVEVSVKLTVSP